MQASDQKRPCNTGAKKKRRAYGWVAVTLKFHSHGHVCECVCVFGSVRGHKVAACSVPVRWRSRWHTKQWQPALKCYNFAACVWAWAPHNRPKNTHHHPLVLDRTPLSHFQFILLLLPFALRLFFAIFLYILLSAIINYNDSAHCSASPEVRAFSI